MKPFPYQQRIIEAVASCSGTRPLVVMPCGAGKTITGLECVRNESSVIWAAHRGELLDQAQEAARTLGISIQTVTIQGLVAMAQKPSGLLVWDECHHSVADEWSQLTHHYPRILGLTATPERADGTGLGSVFTDIIVGVSVKELVELGRLVPIEVIAPGKPLKPGTIAQHPVNAYKKHTPGEQAILFAPNIPAAMQYSSDFEAAGIKAAYVHGTMPKTQRDQVVQDYKSGVYQVLCNVMLLTEGFDDPKTSCVILARGCSTPGTYIQTTSRCGRASPGKSRGMVLDLRGVSHIHGDPGEDRVYSLDGRGIRRKDITVDQRYCAVCGACWSGTTCSDCGNQVEPATPPRVANVKLEKRIYLPGATEEAKVSKLREIYAQQRAKNYKPSWPYVRFSILFGHPATKQMIEKAKRKM